MGYKVDGRVNINIDIDNSATHMYGVSGGVANQVGMYGAASAPFGPFVHLHELFGHISSPHVMSWPNGPSRTQISFPSNVVLASRCALLAWYKNCWSPSVVIFRPCGVPGPLMQWPCGWIGYEYQYQNGMRTNESSIRTRLSV